MSTNNDYPNNCKPINSDAAEYFSFTCPHGTYNPQTTLFFNTEGGVIRALIDGNIDETIPEYLIFIGTWYLFMTTTAGS